jgi:hypothetical protein
MLKMNRTFLLGCALSMLAGIAQGQMPPPPPPPPPGAPPGYGAPAPAFSAPQLDQMLAPIALYPDQVLGTILMAATYPLEIVQADRWLQDPANASLRGSQLVGALQFQPWDPSVKSLTAFPQILAMMDGAIDWTQQVGDAFVAQQADVMDSVQRLRSRALAARTLVPSPQEEVVEGPGAIQIAPAGGDAVYVPVYDPDTAFGDWPYPDYPPFGLTAPGFGYGSVIAFVIVPPLWGWTRWDWGGHSLNVVGTTGSVGAPSSPGSSGGSGSRRPPAPHPWRHMPEHRLGVAYRDDAMRARVQQAARQGSAPRVEPGMRRVAPGPVFPAPVAPTVIAPRPAPRVEPARPAETHGAGAGERERR